MPPELIAVIAAAVMILGFLWSLHRGVVGGHRGGAGVHRAVAGVYRDVAGLRGRMARLEGLFEGLTHREPPRGPHSGGPVPEPPFAGLESTRSH